VSGVEFACAALWAQPFVAWLLVLFVIDPPSEAQLAAADPFLRVLPSVIVPWLAIAVAAAWAWRVRPSRAALARASMRALAGIAVALAAVALLRAIAGPRLPSFVPAEESAAPGRLLSLAAGLGEEVEFRLLLLPVVYFLLARRGSRAVAGVVAVLASAIAFTALHGAAPLSWMVTRFVIPGCLMSAAALLIGPSFVVAAHCSAHLLLPVLFH
jgi:hypothetical protein